MKILTMDYSGCVFFALILTASAELGVDMQPDYMIRYELDQASGDVTPDDLTISIGFSTWYKQGTLMLIRNDDVQHEYIAVEMNNNGGIRVAVDVGFGRDELNTDIPNVDLTRDRQRHLVIVRTTNRWRALSISVDNYPPAVRTWDFVPEDADTQLDRPQYIYFGMNETTRPGGGFEGCLFDAQYNDLALFEQVFQDPRPDNVVVTPEDAVQASSCGIDEEPRKRKTITKFRERWSPEVKNNEKHWLRSLELQLSTIADEEKCRMLQEVGVPFVHMLSTSRQAPRFLFVSLDLLSANGWDFTDDDSIRQHFCHIAKATNRQELAMAFGIPYDQFVDEYSSITQLMAQIYHGPETFYNAVTSVVDMVDFALEVNFHTENNPRPEISYTRARQFVDGMIAEHGQNFPRDIMILMSPWGPVSFDGNLDAHSLAAAISGATSLVTFADISGIDPEVVERMFAAMTFVTEYEPSLLQVMHVTAEYVRVAGELGLFSL